MNFSDHETIIQNLNQISNTRWHDIMKLRSESFVSEQKCIYTDPDDIDTNATHVSITDQDSFIGYARLFKSNNWHIGRVIVSDKYRGHGFGNIIMKSCLDHILSVEPGARIELSSQLYLSNFYKNLSFKIEGSLYLEDGIPHLKMVYSPLVKTTVNNN
jgi:ElaA protein